MSSNNTNLFNVLYELIYISFKGIDSIILKTLTEHLFIVKTFFKVSINMLLYDLRLI